MRAQRQRYDQEEYIYSRGRRIPLSSVRMIVARSQIDGAEHVRRGSSRKSDVLVEKFRSVVRVMYAATLFIVRVVRNVRWTRLSAFIRSMWARLSPVRAWQYSLVFALALGVAGTTLVYGSFGKNVSADEKESGIIVVQGAKGRVLGMETSSEDEQERAVFEDRVREMVEGYPIEDMLPYILKYDRKTAAFLVSIARKESSWGRHVPVYYGENCFNYWGYRGQDEIMGSAGHTCFDTPKEAVITVGKRLQELINEGYDTASKLVIWKCGSSCEGHDSESVNKWISDVNGYYRYAMEGK